MGQSQSSKDKTLFGNLLNFKKLICNLLLNEHPIVIDNIKNTNKSLKRKSNVDYEKIHNFPSSIAHVYDYFLNRKTIYLEYSDIDEFDDEFFNIKNINQTLIFAIKCNNILIVRWLLKNKADLHTQNDLALQLAAKNGHLEIIKLLLVDGANIHANNDAALR